MNCEERTIVAPPEALAWVEADHGAFWAYTHATVVDALERGWTVHRTVTDDLGLRWLPHLAGYADLADIANITFRVDDTPACCPSTLNTSVHWKREWRHHKMTERRDQLRGKSDHNQPQRSQTTHQRCRVMYR